MKITKQEWYARRILGKCMNQEALGDTELDFLLGLIDGRVRVVTHEGTDNIKRHPRWPDEAES